MVVIHATYDPLHCTLELSSLVLSFFSRGLYSLDSHITIHLHTGYIWPLLFTVLQPIMPVVLLDTFPFVKYHGCIAFKFRIRFEQYSQSSL